MKKLIKISSLFIMVLALMSDNSYSRSRSSSRSSSEEDSSSSRKSSKKTGSAKGRGTSARSGGLRKSSGGPQGRGGAARAAIKGKTMHPINNGGNTPNGNANGLSNNSNTSTSSSSVSYDEFSCKDLYVDCMDALVPYVINKNEFLGDDPAVEKMMENDKTLRCVYHYSGDTSDSDLKGSAVSLFLKYNYYCKEGREGKDCDSMASSSTTNSTAYYREIKRKIDEGDYTSLDSSVLDQFGLSDADSVETEVFGEVSLTPPNADLFAKEEFGVSSGICLGGIHKKKLKGFEDEDLENINAYVDGLKSCREHKKALEEFYVKGKKMTSNSCQEGKEECSDLYDSENFTTPEDNCEQYESSLASERLRWKTKAKQLIAANKKEIDRGIKKQALEDVKADVKINSEVSSFMTDNFKTCLDDFRGCMRKECNGEGGDYAGCVTLDGIKESKVLSGGLYCYPSFKSCVVPIARTLADADFSFDEKLQGIVEELQVDDSHYQEMSIDVIKKAVGERYLDLLKESCEEARGMYSSDMCYWPVIHERDSDYLAKSMSFYKTSKKAGAMIFGLPIGGAGGHGRTDMDSDGTKKSLFNKKYFIALPGSSLTCDSSTQNISKTNSSMDSKGGGAVGFFGGGFAHSKSESKNSQSQNFKFSNSYDIVFYQNGSTALESSCEAPVLFAKGWGRILQKLEVDKYLFLIDSNSKESDSDSYVTEKEAMDALKTDKDSVEIAKAKAAKKAKDDAVGAGLDKAGNSLSKLGSDMFGSGGSMDFDNFFDDEEVAEELRKVDNFSSVYDVRNHILPKDKNAKTIIEGEFEVIIRDNWKQLFYEDQ